MKFQVGDLVRPDGHWPPNSRLGCIDLALVVGFAREIPGGYPVPEGKRPIIEVLGGKLHGLRVERWWEDIEKVE